MGDWLGMTPDEFTAAGGSFFQTEKGSLYARLPDGRTVRIKAAGIHAGDEGLKEASDSTFYVDAEGARIAGEFNGIQYMDKPRVILNNGYAHFTYNQGGRRGQHGGPVRVYDQPAEGLSPVELWNPTGGEPGVVEGGRWFRGWHPGHKISRFADPAESHRRFVQAAGGSAAAVASLFGGGPGGGDEAIAAMLADMPPDAGAAGVAALLDGAVSGGGKPPGKGGGPPGFDGPFDDPDPFGEPSDGKRPRGDGQPGGVFDDIRKLLDQLLGEAVKGNNAMAGDPGSRRRQLWEGTRPLRHHLGYTTPIGRVFGRLAHSLPAGMRDRLDRALLGRRASGPPKPGKPWQPPGGWDDVDWQRAADKTDPGSVFERLNKVPGFGKLGLTEESFGKMPEGAQRELARQLGVDPDARGMTADELRDHIAAGGHHPAVPGSVQRAVRKAAKDGTLKPPPVAASAEAAAAGEGAAAEGAAAAGGEAAAVAGLAETGVGIPLAAALALGLAFKSLVDETKKLAREQEQYSRQLAQYSPSQAASLAVLDAERAMRNMASGESQAASADYRNRKVNEYERAVQPYEDAWENVKNRVAGAGMSVAAGVLDPETNPLTSGGVQIAKTLKDIYDYIVHWGETENEKQGRLKKEQEQRDYGPGGYWGAGDVLQQMDRERQARQDAEAERLRRLREEHDRTMRR